MALKKPYVVVVVVVPYQMVAGVAIVDFPKIPHWMEQKSHI